MNVQHPDQGQGAEPDVSPLRPSLHLRVLATVLLSTFLVVLAAESLRLTQSHGDRMELLRQKAERTADIQSQSMRRPMFDYDYQLVELLARAMTSDPELAAVRIEDQDGKPVVSLGTPLPEHIQVSRELIHSSPQFDPVRVGRLTIALSTDQLERDMRANTILGVVGAAAVFIALSLAIAISFRRISHPLGELTGTILRLSQGEKTIAIPGQERQDEIGDIARAAEIFRRHAIAIERLEAEKAAEAAIRESEERLRAIIDALPVPIVVSRLADDTLLFVNRCTCEQFQVGGETLLGTSAKAYYADPADRERLMAAIEYQGHAVNLEARMLKPDGQPFWALISASQTIFGGQTAVLASISDISVRHATEEALREAKTQAETATRAKSEFLAAMSHEIRTPLNGVISMADLLSHSGLTGEQGELAAVLRNSSKALLTVINDILDFSKMEAGKLELLPAPFSLRQVVEDAAMLFGSGAEDKGIELLCHVDPEIPDTYVADGVRLRQVLLNLIGNAVKFTQQGHVLVEATAYCLSDQHRLVLSVTDSGIGIDPDSRERLFQPFEQADSSTERRYGGTGLGLSICQRLTTLMGGTIGCVSVPGRGSRFTVEIPVTPAAAAPPPPVLKAGARVLAVSPSAVFLDTLERGLRGQGATLTARASPEQAFPLDRDGAAPDAVIIDSQIGADQAIALARALRDTPRPAPLAVAFVADQRLRLGLRAEDRALFSAIVGKPLRLADLARAIAPETSLRPAAPIASSPLPPTGARILVAEDNPINQLVITKLMERLGHAVETVGDGRSALHRLRAAPYDLLITDCHMPDMDGYALTRQLREEESGSERHLPVIALTGDAVQGSAQRCLDAGMDDFLTKPVELAMLQAALARWLPSPP